MPCLPPLIKNSFSEQTGNSMTEKPESINNPDNDEIDFSCPVCGQDPCSTDDDSWFDDWQNEEDMVDIL